MPELIIDDLTGGLSTKFPTSMMPNQCQYARNVEWIKSKCGERRNGSTPVDFAGSDLEGADYIMWLFRHTPTNDPADAQLWAIGVHDAFGTPNSVIAYKDTAWHTVTPVDALPSTVAGLTLVSGLSYRGKLFICYNSSVDRLHVWDGTSLRRTGLAEPAAPTAANQTAGPPNVEATARYYRVRYTVRSGSTTLRRSEPSDVLTFTPSGAHQFVRVTKPASISEGETHWELELSSDNINFYVIATTVVATTTVDDNQSLTGLASAGFTLSEDTGDYSLLPSAKYLTTDEDRLVLGGSWEDEDDDSRILWTPVGSASGVGNDERFELDTDPFVHLDPYEGGNITGLSEGTNGYIYAFKQQHIYQGIRTGVRTRAYDFLPLTKQRGALSGSIVSGLDNNGQPCVFAMDYHVGPYRIGSRSGGIEDCGADLIEIWENVRDVAIAAAGTNRAAYIPAKKQVIFGIPNSPRALVLHTQHMRMSEEGFRGGWSDWIYHDTIQCMCMFSTNIDDDTDRNTQLRPFFGTASADGTGIIVRTDTGLDDCGTEFVGTINTKHHMLGNLTKDANVQRVVVFGQAVENAEMTFFISGRKTNYGHVIDATTTDFSVLGQEDVEGYYTLPFAVRKLDALGLNELRTVMIGFGDYIGSAKAKWGIESIHIIYTQDGK